MTDDFESRRTIVRVLRRSKVDPRYRKQVIAVSIAALLGAGLLGLAIPWMLFRSEAPRAKPLRVATCPEVAKPVTTLSPPKATPRTVVIDVPVPSPARPAASQQARRKKSERPRTVPVMLVDPFAQ